MCLMQAKLIGLTLRPTHTHKHTHPHPVLRNSIYGQNDLIAKHGQKSEDEEAVKEFWYFSSFYLLFVLWSLVMEVQSRSKEIAKGDVLANGFWAGKLCHALGN